MLFQLLWDVGKVVQKTVLTLSQWDQVLLDPVKQPFANKRAIFAKSVWTSKPSRSQVIKIRPYLSASHVSSLELPMILLKSVSDH